ncbi:hypothetical protein D3C73_1080730 [compost metagenome]
MAVVARQEAEQQLGQLDHRWVGGVEEHVVVRQLVHLRSRRSAQVLATITELGAPQARHAVQVTLVVVVPEIQALAADHHPRTFGIERLLIHKRMDVVGGIGLLVILSLPFRFEGCIHGFFLFCW